MTKEKILHLTIKYKWFREIALGKKLFEYREIKQYWISRLFNKDKSVREYDEIHIRNGYSLDKPFMRLKWHDWMYGAYRGVDCFVIKVHDIIEIKNFESDDGGEGE